MPEIESNPFIPASPPTTSSATPAADRPKRGPRKAKVEAEKPARKLRVAKAAATKPGRKPRAAKAAPVPAGKLDISTIVSAAVGLKEDEATVLLEVVKALDYLKKTSKPKVLAALTRLFGG